MLVEEIPIWIIKCLLLTIGVEVIGAFLIGIHEKKDILNICLVNIVTNLLVSALTIYADFYYGLTIRSIVIVFCELFAFLYEGFIYWKYLKYRRLNGFVISLILNIFSYVLGEVMKMIAL